MDTRYTWVAGDADPSLTSVQEQSEALFRDIGERLEAVGLTWSHVVLVYLYLNNMADYKVVNGIYGRCFAIDPPARLVSGY